MIGCVHHWVIKDDGRGHQIGMCRECGEVRDFGLNPTIVTPKWMITTDYFINPFNAQLTENPTAEEREYKYPSPPRGFCVPFEPSMDDADA